jgi:D-alanine-D-alanine ligase
VVRQADDLASAARKALGFSAKALVEEYIDGRELTVGIVDDEPLPVIEIVAKGGLYDYSAKYTDPGTRYLVPAPISGEAAARARELGRRAHKSLGCRCFSRIDMMMDLSGEIFVLEANTIPGMTERSLLPKAALASGLRFGDLCVKLIDDALKGRPGNGKAEQAEEGKAPGFRRGR